MIDVEESNIRNRDNNEEIEISEDSYESDEGIDDFVEDDDGAGYSERGYDAPISMRKIRSKHRKKAPCGAPGVVLGAGATHQNKIHFAESR